MVTLTHSLQCFWRAEQRDFPDSLAEASISQTPHPDRDGWSKKASPLMNSDVKILNKIRNPTTCPSNSLSRPSGFSSGRQGRLNLGTPRKGAWEAQKSRTSPTVPGSDWVTWHTRRRRRRLRCRGRGCGRASSPTTCPPRFTAALWCHLRGVVAPLRVLLDASEKRSLAVERGGERCN